MSFRSTISTVAALASIGVTSVGIYKATELPKPQTIEQPQQVAHPVPVPVVPPPEAVVLPPPVVEPIQELLPPPPSDLPIRQ
jgi:hypothetical protein